MIHRSIPNGWLHGLMPGHKIFHDLFAFRPEILDAIVWAPLAQLGVGIFFDGHHVTFSHILETRPRPKGDSNMWMFLARVAVKVVYRRGGSRNTRKRHVHLELLFDDGSQCLVFIDVNIVPAAMVLTLQ